ncbi:hypothetical protein GCM10010495_65080 [Kitasatospora herbaricolor]|nr:hypothetical protein GCM10010495_65080 [Kitasatospora herbaricolor]
MSKARGAVPVAVMVCGVRSSLTTVTVVPGATVSSWGRKVKSGEVREAGPGHPQRVAVQVLPLLAEFFEKSGVDALFARHAPLRVWRPLRSFRIGSPGPGRRRLHPVRPGTEKAACMTGPSMGPKELTVQSAAHCRGARNR